jgi:hypothetical protein
MSLAPLENPLTRLTLFPNTMNYRGGWSATEQYYSNDVVGSGINNNTYILTGKTTILGGGDPSTNTDWEVISSIDGGVQSVTALEITGVKNIGNAQNVVLVNSGVISITTDVLTGIQNTGNAQNQVLVNSGVISVTTPLSSGITISGTPNNRVISNSGVISLATSGPSSGITISGPPNNPVIANDGVLSITAQNGCSNTGSSTNPVIVNSGVITCVTPAVPANGGIVIGGTIPVPTFSWAPLATGTLLYGTNIDPNPSPVTLPFNLTANAVVLLTSFGTDCDKPYQMRWYFFPTTPNQLHIESIPSFPNITLIQRRIQYAVMRA